MVGGIQFQKVQAMSFLQLRLQLFLTGSSFDSWTSASPTPINSVLNFLEDLWCVWWKCWEGEGLTYRCS